MPKNVKTEKRLKARKPRDLRDLKPAKDAKGGMRKSGGDPTSAGHPF
jgi:hypothetical protein